MSLQVLQLKVIFVALTTVTNLLVSEVLICTHYVRLKIMDTLLIVNIPYISIQGLVEDDAKYCTSAWSYGWGVPVEPYRVE